MAACVLAYALSPIDLIPDFIPVLGQLDDLLLVPLGLWLCLEPIPPEVMAEAREKAAAAPSPDRSRIGTLAVALTWVDAPDHRHARACPAYPRGSTRRKGVDGNVPSYLGLAALAVSEEPLDPAFQQAGGYRRYIHIFPTALMG